MPIKIRGNELINGVKQSRLKLEKIAEKSKEELREVEAQMDETKLGAVQIHYDSIVGRNRYIDARIESMHWLEGAIAHDEVHEIAIGEMMLLGLFVTVVLTEACNMCGEEED